MTNFQYLHLKIKMWQVINISNMLSFFFFANLCGLYFSHGLNKHAM